MGVLGWITAQRPEWLALAVNATMVVRYTIQWQEPGKILYWVGACVLTVGVLLMKG